MSFVLYGNVQLVPGKYDGWQAAYDNLGEYVFNNEPTTETYYFGVPIEYKDDLSASNQILAFEVYGKREDLYETHFHSPAMDAFLAFAPACMSTGFDLMHYVDVTGFRDKPRATTPCKLIYDTKIRCASAEARDAVLARLEPVARHAEVDEPGTLSFWVLESRDDEVSIRIFERYADWPAFRAHQDHDGWKGFLLGMKEKVRSLEGRAFVPNHKGWLHH